MTIDGPESYPVNSRYGMGDTIAGTTLFGAVMAALYTEKRTGQGGVTTSLFNAGIWAFGGGIVAEKPYEHHFQRFGIESHESGLSLCRR